MQPKERRETGEQDLFRSRLDQIIDLQHALVRLARSIDWRFLEEKFGAVYTDKPGHPPLPTRLMAGLAILKHMQDLSDEALCEHWIENPYYQYFCGEEFFQHRLVFDRSSLTRWRQRMGEEKLQALRAPSGPKESPSRRGPARWSRIHCRGPFSNRAGACRKGYHPPQIQILCYVSPGHSRANAQARSMCLSQCLQVPIASDPESVPLDRASSQHRSRRYHQRGPMPKS
jgi:Transposase domain (DUF772)